MAPPLKTMPALQSQSGDSVEDLWRKIVTNQAGAQAPLSGDGERDLVKKALQNQATDIDAGGGSWTSI